MTQTPGNNNPAQAQSTPTGQQQSNPFPHIALPGLSPDPNPRVVVKNINPPITPDQVVSMAESPSAAPRLPEIKLQNIKIPPVKNKTIQGHLNAIEAKMIATEKLMKDIVKLQKFQIHTEKELHQRRRELYQNTFEEYLLDKTIDFEDPEDPDCTCINLPKKPPGFPPIILGGGRGTRSPANPTESTEKENQQTSETEISGTLSNDYKDTENEAFKNAEEWEKTKKKKQEEAERIRRATKILEEARKKLDPLYDPMEKEAEDEDTITRPGQDPGYTPLPVKPIDVPEPKTDPADIARTIAVLQYIRKNSKNKTPTIRRKDGYVVTLDGNGNPRVFKPGELELDPLSQTLLRSMAATEAVMAVLPAPVVRGAKGRPVAPLRPKPPGRPVTPVVPSPPANDIKPGPRVIPTSPSPAARTAATSDAVVDVKATSKETIIPTVVGENLGRGAQNPIKKTKPKTTEKSPVLYQASGGISDLNLYSAQSQEYFRNVSQEYSKNIPKFGGGGIFDWIKSKLSPQGLARGLKGVSAGFTGMNAQGFGAMMRGEGYKASSKPQILGRGAYSAPTLRGAQRYAGATGSLGGTQTPGGVVNSIVPGNASRINFIEPQSKVSPDIFNKGRDLATKLQQGAYPNSARANMLRGQITAGSAVPKTSVRPGNPVSMLIQLIADELINPRSTAVYDQVSGPNAYYNAPGYKGPKPSDALENAQDNMKSGSNNQQSQMVPLPPDYIKIPGSSKEKTKSTETFVPPGIEMRSSIFTRSSTYIDE